MGFVVVEQKRWQRVYVLFLKLKGQVLHEVVKAPLMCALLKLDIVAVPEGFPNTTVYCESSPLIRVRGYWYR